jgi:hypothetical protein
MPTSLSIFFAHLNLAAFCHYRLIGIIALLETLATIAGSLWIAQTSVFQSMADNSTVTNKDPQAYDMRLHFALLLSL